MCNAKLASFSFQLSSLLSATMLHLDPSFLYYVYKTINLPSHPSKMHINIFTMFFNNELLSVSIESWHKRWRHVPKGTNSLFEYSFEDYSQLFSTVLVAPLLSLSLYIIYFSTTPTKHIYQFILPDSYWISDLEDQNWIVLRSCSFFKHEQWTMNHGHLWYILWWPYGILNLAALSLTFIFYIFLSLFFSKHTANKAGIIFL